MLKSALFTHLERGARPSAGPDASVKSRAWHTGLPDTLAGRAEIHERTASALRAALETGSTPDRDTLQSALLLLQHARPFLVLHGEDAAPPGGQAATVRRPVRSVPASQTRYWWQPLLRSARARQGLTQVQVSKKIHVQQTTYAFWERGDHSPTAATAERVFPLLRALLDLPETSGPTAVNQQFLAPRPRAKRRRYVS